MELLHTVRDITNYLQQPWSQEISIGFVPTMGALHEGHLTLIRRSVAENDLTVCSIFVNPIQFNNQEDLSRYPRTLEKDALMLQNEGCNMIFAPTVEEMYPPGESISIDIEFGLLDKVMEGKYRPGHFRGVAVVVRKLFEMVKPTRAYFGKKDFQQLVIIRFMVNTFQMPLEIIPCDTVREPGGLAMSSRNLRLSAAERQSASLIYDTLCQVRENAGKFPVGELREWAIKKINSNPRMKVEYFEICDSDTLLPVDTWALKERSMAFTAVFLGGVRLIDNIALFS